MFKESVAMKKNNDYQAFLNLKKQLPGDYGFAPVWMPDFLIDFQAHLTNWAIRKARALIAADCGLGKTAMQLVWAENVIKKTNKNVLILTPLAVSRQTISEGEKFGVEVKRSRDGNPKGKLTVTNYEQLEKFNPSDYIGVVADESSILKNYSGKRKKQIIRFMAKLPFRLLCTATAAPNDYTELGNSSEALGEMKYMDMLERFFRDTSNDKNPQWKRGEYRKEKYVFRGHSSKKFWRFVLSWARACRKPSDLGFPDGKFNLPGLIENKHTVKLKAPPPGWLFRPRAVGRKDELIERLLSITERAEKIAELVEGHGSSIIWCDLNQEGDTLEEIIPDAVQVAGKDSDEAKEEKLTAFSNGEIKRLVTKAKIGGFGMNWQHCSHMTNFPTHSYEQYYQFVRRCYRFGQENNVTVDTVMTDGEMGVYENVIRKANNAKKMFSELVKLMNEELKIKNQDLENIEINVPNWLKGE